MQAAKGRPELWNRGWLNAGMELGGREGASDVRGSGAVAKNRKACLRVCFYCLFTMYVGMCVAHKARVLDQSRNPTLLENEVFNLDRFFQIPEANPSKCVHSTFPEKSFKWIVCFLTF